MKSPYLVSVTISVSALSVGDAVTIVEKAIATANAIVLSVESAKERNS